MQWWTSASAHRSSKTHNCDEILREYITRVCEALIPLAVLELVWRKLRKEERKRPDFWLIE